MDSINVEWKRLCIWINAGRYYPTCPSFIGGHTQSVGEVPFSTDTTMSVLKKTVRGFPAFPKSIYRELYFKFGMTPGLRRIARGGYYITQKMFVTISIHLSQNRIFSSLQERAETCTSATRRPCRVVQLDDFWHFARIRWFRIWPNAPLCIISCRRCAWCQRREHTHHT